MDQAKTLSMVRMGQQKDIPEVDVEDALCSGWVRAEDAPEAAAPRRGQPVRV